MPATIEKNITPQLTAKTPTPPPLTPLEIANTQIVSAKAASPEEGERRRRAWMAHRNVSAIVSPSATIPQQVALETAHINEGHRLRSLSVNYRPEAVISGLLDTADNKAVLADALAFVRKLHADHLKRPKPVAAKVEMEGRHLFQAESPHAMPIPAPRPPILGPWGQDKPLDIGKELNRIGEAVDAFPLSDSYEQIVGKLNAVHSAIVALNPESKPAQAVRQDKGWRVPAHM